jgi:hypothetical protein
VRENPEIEKERERERKNPPHTRKKKTNKSNIQNKKYE